MKAVNWMAACMLCAALAGCASSGNGQIETLTQQRAAAMLVKGQTTRDEVRLALGDALVSAFPSGQQVWFYQYTDSPARLVRYVPLVGRMSATGAKVKELRILFDKDGRVQKFKLQDIRLQ
jgi:outer membrane protein assembly factor BamE (lipoprotein component of BamABCDE complex)